MTTSTKKKDASVKTTEEVIPASEAADSQTHESSGKGPVWKTSSNRVNGAIWKNDHQGQARHSISISRSFYDQRESKWRYVHSFDLADLADVKVVADAAYDFIRSITAQDTYAGQEAQA